MPDYGLSDSEDGLLDWSWAVEHLRFAQRYWVSSVDPLGQPHISGVWAVWADDALWFSCGPRARKARNLLADGRCAVATERADEAVTITGEAVRVDGAAPIESVTEAYVAKYGEAFPDPGANPLFAVRPDVVIGIIESDMQTRATRWTFAPTLRIGA